MSGVPKKSFLLLLSLILALLPLRYAVSGSVSSTLPGSNSEMAFSMPGCAGLAMSASESDPGCPGHLPGGKGASDCCGDHCGSSLQMLLTTELNISFPASPLHFEERSAALPEIFLSPEQRPPLTLS